MIATDASADDQGLCTNKHGSQAQARCDQTGEGSSFEIPCNLFSSIVLLNRQDSSQNECAVPTRARGPGPVGWFEVSKRFAERC